ncbi:MAG: Crp/Fnr family transcriptional regulator [Alphaproteobacteria bacterium]|nr:Crp/Fnr family transcriptional regulator [Alphaproteobacteria bacterium]
MGGLVYAEPESDVLARLKHIAPFVALRTEDMLSLLAAARPAVATPGTVLPSSGPAGKVLYVLLEGSVCLMRGLPKGQRCLVEICDAPCLIGEIALFEEQATPPEAEVLHRAILVELPAETVRHCFRNSPAAHLRMLGYMSARLKRLIAQITTLKLMTGPQRLAHFLLALAERGSNGRALRLPFEKRTVAALLGMTPESLSRAFRRLLQLGVRSGPGGDVAIDDLERLRQFIEAETPS